MSTFRHSNKINLIIEGNIGAGKSTFLRLLANALDVQPVFERHDKWQDVGGGNLLDHFYQDTQRWGYTFQTYAFVSRVVEQEKFLALADPKPLVLERSVYSDRYCFAKNAYEMGLMSGLEWDLYKNWFSWLVESYTVRPTGFIYLQAEPEICFKRMQTRGRHEEKTVGLDYLQRLHDKHEQWLLQKQEIAPYLRDLPVLVLDCNPEFERDLVHQARLFAQVRSFYNLQEQLNLPPKSSAAQLSL